MTKVIIYTKDHCSYCKMAKDLLNSRHVPFKEIPVDKDPSKLDDMIRLSNRRTVPQIFINDQAIGGYDDLAELVRSGKFDSLLKS